MGIGVGVRRGANVKQTIVCYNAYYMFLHSSSLRDRRNFCAFFRRARRWARELRGARFARSPLLLNRRRMLLSIECIQWNATSRTIDRQKGHLLNMFACGRQDNFNYIPIWTQWHYLDLSLFHPAMSADDHTRDARVPGIHSRVAFPSGRWFSCSPSGSRRQCHEHRVRLLIYRSLKLFRLSFFFIRPLSGNVDNLLGIRVMGRAFHSFSLDFPWGEGAEAQFGV